MSFRLVGCVLPLLGFLLSTWGCAAPQGGPKSITMHPGVEAALLDRLIRDERQVLMAGLPEMRALGKDLKATFEGLERRWDNAADAAARTRIALLVARYLCLSEELRPWQVVRYKFDPDRLAGFLVRMLAHDERSEAALLYAMEADDFQTLLANYPELRRPLVGRLKQGSKQDVQYGVVLCAMDIGAPDREIVWRAIEKAMLRAVEDSARSHWREQDATPVPDPVHLIRGHDIVESTFDKAAAWKRPELTGLCVRVLKSNADRTLRATAARAFSKSVEDSPEAREASRLILEQRIQIPFGFALDFIERHGLAGEFRAPLAAMAAHYNPLYHLRARKLLAAANLPLPEIAPVKFTPENARMLAQFYRDAWDLGPEAKRGVVAVWQTRYWGANSNRKLVRGWGRPLKDGRVEFLTDEGSLLLDTAANLELQHTDFQSEVRFALERLRTAVKANGESDGAEYSFEPDGSYGSVSGIDPGDEALRMMRLLSREADPANPQAPEIAEFISLLIPRQWLTEEDLIAHVCASVDASFWDGAVNAFCDGSDDVVRGYAQRIEKVRGHAPDRISAQSLRNWQAMAEEIGRQSTEPPASSDKAAELFELARRKPHPGAGGAYFHSGLGPPPDMEFDSEAGVELRMLGPRALPTLIALLDDTRVIRRRSGSELDVGGNLAADFLREIVRESRSEWLDQDCFKKKNREELKAKLRSMFPELALK